ncbi:MAG: FprA family A-type flavoprotein [Synergistales bacterium]|nr:FprA family A-type flavoprotein [Synergistales bacterium]MDY6401563.1 FprA family A-type flavoprotein [Synergistales bacterium]MDY6405001.1 FprA family A-type flavoprotein [Synergistales bacterium]MDY6410302.1 FprA family A-type flavoprotein [Synergistales bacterium]MDY6413556.1 FprA family A-type flavoprotein [Synergistales bacterium]
MYNAIQVNKDTWWTGVNDHDTDLFESLWPLPQGVAYNAYVITGTTATAAIDTVKGPYLDEYYNKLLQALGGRALNYLVINHMEPDHAGLIAQLKKQWPSLKFIGNVKTVPLLKGYHGIEEDVITVKDGDTLDLGGHVLRFATVPMLHWPESMVTFDTTTGVLFSNDSFGGFGAHEGGLFDDEKLTARWAGEMLRYYACIVAKYSNVVQAALKKLGALEIKNIFPSHGTLFRKDIKQVISLYDKWSKQEAEQGAVVVYGSMYGNTKRMAEAVCTGLAEAKVKDVRIYDASRADMSNMLRDIWRFKGLALLSCTYNTVLYPPMEALCSKLLNRMPKNKVLGLAGSYSWSKGALTALQDFAEKIKLEKIGPEVEVYTSPTDEDLKKCCELGKNLGEAVLS